jgi:hypothetical protein
MTKILINEEGRPMHNPKGWPDAHTEGYAATDMYAVDLEEAKAEAIEIIAPGQFLALGPSMKPDTFIEIDAEVEVGHQYKVNGLWRDASEENCWKYSNERGCETRKVARIKKQESLKLNKAQLDSAGDPIPHGHIQCPNCLGSGEKVPDVECKKCEGSGYVPDSAHSFTESAGITGHHGPIDNTLDPYSMPAEEKAWREKAHEEDKQRYAEQDSLFKVLKQALIEADVAPVDCDEIATGMMPIVEKHLRSTGQRENAELKAKLENWDAKMRSMESSTPDLDKKISGLHKKFLVKSLDDVEEFRAKLEKAEANLKSWESLWGPVIDYCQNTSNATRLGIKLGDSISKRILEIIQEK